MVGKLGYAENQLHNHLGFDMGHGILEAPGRNLNEVQRQLLSNIKNMKLERFGFLIVDKVGILPELYKYTKIANIGGGFGKGVHSTTASPAYLQYKPCGKNS